MDPTTLQTTWYALLGDAQDHLEAFYRRYGCELVHKADGYYYLLPTGDKLSRRQLSASDMLVGQALALLYLHPSTVERAGLHTMEELIAQLAAVMGTDALIRAFYTKRRRYDERVAQKAVRARVGEATRRLSALAHKPRVVAISVHEQMPYPQRMMEAGAVAFTDGRSSIHNTQVLRRVMTYAREFDAVIALPFGPFGIRAHDGQVQELVFLPPGTPLHEPRNASAGGSSRRAMRQLKAPREAATGRPASMPSLVICASAASWNTM